MRLFHVDIAARTAILAAAICGGVLVVAFTELLGSFRGLRFGWLISTWGVVLSAGLLLARPRGLGARPRPRLPLLGHGLDLAMAAFIAGVVALTGAIALFAVPITVDSMTYHLARVAHWAQDATVAFYPAHVIRQLHPPPWAEYAILHLFILWGGDRLANLVQWVSMVLSLVGVSLIARQLGAGTRGQLLATFVCATIPMGVMQASTTQNDYVAALWLVCLVSALLAIGARPGPLPVLGAGASLGLALLTKGTAYVFAAPFVVVFLLSGRARPTSQRLGQGLVIGLCALALNAPHYARNVHVFGSPLGPGGEGNFRYLNDAVSPSILASNLVRNIGLHVGTPSPAANAWLERVIAAAHREIGIALDDPRSTWPHTRFEVLPPRAHEDLAGNGLHLLLVGVAMVGTWRAGGDRRARLFAGCLLAAFVLFCILLRWQPWHSRLHLPLFVLGAPLVGLMLERVKPAVLALVLLLLAVSSAFFLTRNPAHPLVGRKSVFRLTWAEQRAAHAGPAYVGAARFVIHSGCREVALAFGSNDSEYFLWGVLADAGWRGKLEPVLVANASARLSAISSRSFRPCAVVRQGATSGIGLTIDDTYYRSAWSRDEIQVLVPASVDRSLALTGPPAVRLLLDRSRFQPGDQVMIGLEARNPLDTGAPADLYVGIALPDGRSAAFVGPAGLLSDPVSLADARGFPRAAAAAPGFTLSAPVFIGLTLPVGIPHGTYRIFAFIARSRVPRGQSIAPEDFLASTFRDVVVAP